MERHIVLILSIKLGLKWYFPSFFKRNCSWNIMLLQVLCTLKQTLEARSHFMVFKKAINMHSSEAFQDKPICSSGSIIYQNSAFFMNITISRHFYPWFTWARQTFSPLSTTRDSPLGLVKTIKWTNTFVFLSF